MKIAYLYGSILVLISGSCHKGKHNPEACNTGFRRELKELTDEKVGLINLVSDTVSVTEIGNLDVPDIDKKSDRQSVEQQLYTVKAKVLKATHEADGDYHILLEENGNYLICENPNPGCMYAQNSAYLAYYQDVRYFIENNSLVGKMVTITGVGFIDFNHHNSKKHSKNFMELHPVLVINF